MMKASLLHRGAANLLEFGLSIAEVGLEKRPCLLWGSIPFSDRLLEISRVANDCETEF